ncbi:MAG TPA: LysR substrate-binding domain-containing protein [Candidatus Acidoferrales bacterium]
MELRQLRYFIAVAERLSYSKAAEELHVSISPLSRQIRQLEDEFDVRLFDRDRRRVALTDAGVLFLQDAKLLISQTARVADRLRQAKKGEAGAARVGIALHLADKVGDMVVEHAKRYPAVDIQCDSIFSTLQNGALVEGKIDIGFLRPPVDTVRLSCEFLYEERLIAMMSRAHPLAKRKTLRIKDLADETLFLPDPSVGGGLLKRTLELFAKAGVSPRVSPMTADPLSHGEVHKVLLAANKGIFIIADEASTRAENRNIAVAVPIDDPDARIDVYMAWRKTEQSPTVLAILDTARAVLGTLPARTVAAVSAAEPTQSRTGACSKQAAVPRLQS